MTKDTGKDQDRDQNALEAAVFRRLVAHLQKRTDVQNIDLMGLAGFCRNCLSNWYEEEARLRGQPVERAAARELVYGMPYEEWKTKYQTEATHSQKEAFKAQHKHDSAS